MAAVEAAPTSGAGALPDAIKANNAMMADNKCVGWCARGATRRRPARPRIAAWPSATRPASLRFDGWLRVPRCRPSFEPGKKVEEFRVYHTGEADGGSSWDSVVSNHYRLMRTNQTVAFVDKMVAKWGKFDKAKMTIREGACVRDGGSSAGGRAARGGGGDACRARHTTGIPVLACCPLPPCPCSVRGPEGLRRQQRPRHRAAQPGAHAADGGARAGSG